jgi:hypothetical protein
MMDPGRRDLAQRALGSAAARVGIHRWLWPAGGTGGGGRAPGVAVLARSRKPMSLILVQKKGSL